MIRKELGFKGSARKIIPILRKISFTNIFIYLLKPEWGQKAYRKENETMIGITLEK